MRKVFLAMSAVVVLFASTMSWAGCGGGGNHIPPHIQEDSKGS
ncbi:hypothetical protein N9R79_11000 [Vibrio sp.]|nr:hypothetical protein [Vibrio sp.]